MKFNQSLKNRLLFKYLNKKFWKILDINTDKINLINNLSSLTKTIKIILSFNQNSCD